MEMKTEIREHFKCECGREWALVMPREHYYKSGYLHTEQCPNGLCKKLIKAHKTTCIRVETEDEIRHEYSDKGI